MNSGTVLAVTDGLTNHDLGLTANACDRDDIADEIEIEPIVECGVDRVWYIDKEQRITIWRRAHYCLGGNIRPGARSVLDHERLAESLRQPLTDQTSDKVIRATGRSTRNYAHRPCRIGLRPRNP